MTKNSFFDVSKYSKDDFISEIENLKEIIQYTEKQITNLSLEKAKKEFVEQNRPEWLINESINKLKNYRTSLIKNLNYQKKQLEFFETRFQTKFSNKL